MDNQPKGFFCDVETVEVFKAYEYNPAFYEKSLNHYKNGGKLYAFYKKYENFKEVFDKNVEFSTVEEFEEFIWDSFAELCEKQSYYLLFPAYGLKLKNPYRAQEIYYDGLILALCSKEFMDIVNNQKENLNISRMLSLLVHFNYNGFYFTSEEYKL